MSTYTAEQYRQMAAESRQRSTGIDEDGFYKEGSALSDWAGNVMAGRYLAAAAFLEDGERVLMTALFNTDGTIASTHSMEGQWGDYWVLNDATAERYGKRFYTPSRAHKNADADRRKGFTHGTISVPGYLDSNVITHADIAALKAGNFEVVMTDDLEGRPGYCVGTCCGGEG